MTFPSPKIDDRRFQDLVRETLDRIPAHTPEWTHLGESDPGVTLVELFSFLAESVLYRANRVPEAARAKFLDLLGLKLRPAIPARGLVVFDATKEPGSRRLDAGVEVRSGSVPFRTTQSLDIFPLDSLALVKETVVPTQADLQYYRMLYQSITAQASAEDSTTVVPSMYRTRVLDGREPVRLSTQTVDGNVWIALLLPEPFDSADATRLRLRAREFLAGKFLSVGIAPWLEERPRTLAAARGQGASEDPTPIQGTEIPRAEYSDSAEGRRPTAGWKARPFRGGGALHKGPDVIEVQMPGTAAELDISAWDDMDPLESGVGEFPPALLDSKLAQRVAGWVRIVPSTSADLSISWAGINTAWIEQRQIVENEVLGTGNGNPDQVFRLREKGVVGGSARIQVLPEDDGTPWTEIDDLAASGPEVRWTDPTSPPGTGAESRRPVKVFAVDEAEGTVAFGDGLRGKRPSDGAKVVAAYETTLGSQGNLPAGSIRNAPDLPPTVRPRNPIPTWGGSDPESLKDASRRVPAWMRHRDRLVTAEDFEEIARSAPGVDLGRIEVLPAWHPDLKRSLPGDVPGAVTLMVVPRGDARDPARPMPDSVLLESLCRHLDPRRLVTTEIVVRGPEYVPLRLSIGFTVAGGFSAPEVRDRLEARIRRYLAPLREDAALPSDADSSVSYPGMEKGWPLRKEVNRLELMAEASREDGVLRVDELILDSDRIERLPDAVELFGLELPWLSVLSVTVGAALSMESLRGTRNLPDTRTEVDPVSQASRTSRRFPLPVVPETC